MTNRMLPVPEAALYLGLSESTLNQWRCKGKGPAYAKLGNRVVYPKSELDLFLANNMHGKAVSRA